MRFILTLILWTIKLLMLLVLLVGIVWFVVRKEPYPDTIQYGVSFNTLYATELGLPWEDVYRAILEELGVRHVRLAAHWTLVAPQQGEWNFAELDRQIELAEMYGVDVVLAVGRRLPRWPECHVPEWAIDESWETQKEHIREYIEVVVERYKNSEALVYWQVENEPFLTVYATEQCGELDTAFLEEEIALVRSHDSSHPILVTDSGNLGTWVGAYRRGDLFGTSVYVYLYNEATGPIETLLPPEMYIAKRKVMELLFERKESMLIELSMEPWLDRPVVETDIETQLARMNMERFETILAYARDTRFQKQYLWGVEWWYWLKVTQGHPEFWERAKILYTTPPQGEER